MQEDLEKVSSGMMRYPIAGDIPAQTFITPGKTTLTCTDLYLHFISGFSGEVEELFHLQYWRPASGDDVYFMGLLTQGPR